MWCCQFYKQSSARNMTWIFEECSNNRLWLFKITVTKVPMLYRKAFNVFQYCLKNIFLTILTNKHIVQGKKNDLGNIPQMTLYLNHLNILPPSLLTMSDYLTTDWLVYDAERHFQQYFSYIMVVSFIGRGNRSTRRKPPGFELTTLVMICTDCTCSWESKYHAITSTSVHIRQLYLYMSLLFLYYAI
jgi:hypothetical protein